VTQARPIGYGPTGRSRCRLVADAADGADGIFERLTYPDGPAPCPAFTTRGNVDTYCPQEGLRAPQAARKRAGIFRPAGAVPRSAITVATAARPQKVAGTTRPQAALGHDLPHASGDRIPSLSKGTLGELRPPEGLTHTNETGGLSRPMPAVVTNR
jgi:hypothetical protein